MKNKLIISTIIFMMTLNFLPTMKIQENLENTRVSSIFYEENSDFKMPKICGYQQVNGWKYNRFLFK